MDPSVRATAAKKLLMQIAHTTPRTGYRTARMADEVEDEDEPRPRGKQYITRAGADRLHRELVHLLNEERPIVTAEVSAAAAQGDRSENAEYIYGKKRLREIDRRMRFLTKRLESAVLVDPKQQKGDKIFFGA